MKNILMIGLVLFFWVTESWAQVIEADPETPSIHDSIDITFYTDRCDCNLSGFTGDIYAHTGLITVGSADPDDWKYEIAGWTENLEKAKLEPINSTTYVLRIRPSLKEYYDIDDAEAVEQMAFVFRSADGSMQTANIYYDVYDSGLTVRFAAPKKDTVIVAGSMLSVKATATALNTTDVDSIVLYVDNVPVHTSYTDTLQHQFSPAGDSLHWLKITAVNSEFSASDSISFFFREDVVTGALPSGAKNGVVPVDDSAAWFTLYAPGKDHVFLVGDFNNWQLDNRYLMHKTPEGDQFWLEVDGLDPEAEYAYQYRIDGSIKVADPYTSKILDPDNDPFIPATTYPNLKAYPEGKTTGIVSVMQTVKETYSWEVNDFVPAAREDLVIYEIHVQNYTEAGNFQGLIDTLDYLVTLGVNAVELMPVNEFEGNQSWGYNPSFYFAVDKIYGTPNDFKALVDACHARGMAVIIDMVHNHSYSQSPLLHMYWNEDLNRPAADNPWYNETHNFLDNTAAQWGYDFNHESEATQAFFDSVNSHWMSEYRVDGFRFDFTKGLSNTPWTGQDNWGSAYDADRIAILKRMSDAVWARNENALILFEHLSDNSEETELANYGIMLWGNMNHPYNEATMGYNESNKSDLTWGVYTSRGWSEPHLVTYMESHDEERLMYKNQRWGNETANYNTKELRVALNRAEAAAAFFFTLPGPKMIWQWGELGYDYSINRCEDGTVDDDGGCRLSPKPLGWDLFEEPMRYRLYKAYEALIDFKQLDICRTTDFDLHVEYATKRIYLYSTEMNAVIVGNFGMQSYDIPLTFPSAGNWYSYMTGEVIEVPSTDHYLNLAPGEYLILTDVPLETPDLPTGLTKADPVNSFLLYPNPARDEVMLIAPESGSVQFNLYSTTGRLLYSKTIELFAGQPVPLRIDRDELGKGICLYQIVAPEFSDRGILILE